MPNKLFKKGLVVGIIVLFIGISVLSSVSSKDVSVANDRIVNDNNEVEPLDFYKDIFAYVSGNGYSREEVHSGFNPFVRFLIGDFHIRAFSLKPLGWYEAWPGSLTIPIFIGDAYPTGNSYYEIDGIVLGNIGWS